jgi:hypothetical protein
MSKQVVIFAVCLAILNLSAPTMARAELVGTLQAVESHTRAEDLAKVSAALARSEVRAKFVELGVDPAAVDARVALKPGDLPARPDLDRYMTAAAGFEVVGRPDDARLAYQAALRHWPDAALPRLGLANLAATGARMGPTVRQPVICD